MSTHRIHLRGPWVLAIEKDCIRTSRKFHAPSGLDVSENTSRSEVMPPSPIFMGEATGARAPELGSESHSAPDSRVELTWLCARNAVVESVLLNKTVVFDTSVKLQTQEPSPPTPLPEDRERRDDANSKTFHEQIDITAILKAFNELTIYWKLTGQTNLPSEGRYTPGPNHPLHLDTWLEIHE
jgi:hypothetical protein